MASTSLAKIGSMRCGREVTGALPSGTEISKGVREKEPKSVWELEKHPRIRRGRRLVPRWPQGSIPGYESRNYFGAHASASGARRAGRKSFFRESNARAGQARARPWLQLLRERIPQWPPPQARSWAGRRLVHCSYSGNGNGCAHQWGVGDSQKIAGLEVGRATDGEDQSP